MTDKTSVTSINREAYKESGHRLEKLNPFVDMPRIRVDALNRINELIERDTEMAVKEVSGDIVLCGACGLWTSKRAFCSHCGQRQNTNDIAF